MVIFLVNDWTIIFTFPLRADSVPSTLAVLDPLATSRLAFHPLDTDKLVQTVRHNISPVSGRTLLGVTRVGLLSSRILGTLFGNDDDVVILQADNLQLMPPCPSLHGRLP